MTLTPRRVVPVLGVIAAVLVGIVAIVAVTADDETAAPGSTSSPSSTAPSPPSTADGVPSTVDGTSTTVATTAPPVERGVTTTVVSPPEADDDRYDPVSTDLSTVERRQPQSVATAWCAYWTRTKSETAPEWAERLEPIATPEMVEALADLNFGGEDPYTREAESGALTSLGDNRWRIDCTTRTVRPDGAPIAPPEPTNAVVTLVEDDDGWKVSATAQGGLVLPDGAGQN